MKTSPDVTRPVPPLAGTAVTTVICGFVVVFVIVKWLVSAEVTEVTVPVPPLPPDPDAAIVIEFWLGSVKSVTFAPATNLSAEPDDAVTSLWPLTSIVEKLDNPLEINDCS